MPIFVDRFLPLVPFLGEEQQELKEFLVEFRRILQDTFIEELKRFQYVGHVDRGDPSAVDFAVGSLTTDGGWYDLDLSSIVPANAVAVDLLVEIQDDAVNSGLQLRKNGNSNAINVAIARTQVVNVSNYLNTTIPCDSSRVIEYSASNLTWTTINITVRGWWLHG
jgi:hypothetical protein